ncbi:MAG: hypothetical protein QOH58_3580 [Thermoleophilaceae bacterium]|jgi:hypothetical protein|nr:hypothetical protein [Thermoleophilaceae bacterium]
MRARTLAIAVAAAVLSATAPAEALAHSLFPPFPVAGDGGSVFTFQGRAWQAGGTVQAQYFRRDTDRRPYRVKNFRASSTGRFTFRLIDPWFYDTGRMQRMCFAQFDTRFGRTFRKCKGFYVAPASAYFMPADGEAGQVFILVATGFEAGRTLTIELLRPDGVLETYTMRTRTRAGFVQGGEFGPLFVPRGGAFRRFDSNPTDPLGLYTAFVFQSDAPARARASVFVRPPG